MRVLVSDDDLVSRLAMEDVLLQCGPPDITMVEDGAAAWQALRELGEPGEEWHRDWGPEVRRELRQLLGQYVTYLMGRRPRLLPYLGS